MQQYLFVCMALFGVMRAPSLFAQKEDNKWLMGYGGSVAGPPFGSMEIDFSSGEPLVGYYKRACNFRFGNASICDTNGQIACYSNGVVMFNSEHDTMQGGDMVLCPLDETQDSVYGGGGAPRGIMILPAPGHDSVYYMLQIEPKYYLYHNPFLVYAERVRYHKIDLRVYAPYGAVVEKNTELLKDTIGSTFTACRHANGRDWWFFAHLVNDKKSYCYLLDPAGFHLAYAGDLPWTLDPPYPAWSWAGQVPNFSTDGSKYIINGGTYVHIWDFDRCTGVLTDPVQFSLPPNSSTGYGIAVSPNSRYLYVTNIYQILQYDLQAPDIAASIDTVAIYDGSANPFGSTFFMLQLAPDGKIYGSCTNAESVLHVIDYPDSAGKACHVRQHGLQLPAYCAYGLPNYPNFRLGPLVGSGCDTLAVGLDAAAGAGRDRPLLRIYPNPATDEVVVELAGFGNLAGLGIEITNLQGRIVAVQAVAGKVSSTAISLANMPAGAYIVKLTRDGSLLYTGKLLVSP